MITSISVYDPAVGNRAMNSERTPGYEADDLIVADARLGREAGRDVLIVRHAPAPSGGRAADHSIRTGSAVSIFVEVLMRTFGYFCQLAQSVTTSIGWWRDTAGGSWFSDGPVSRP
jgi:hypothetical protein